jgi:multiple sugar transport system substrate-binding protein
MKAGSENYRSRKGGSMRTRNLLLGLILLGLILLLPALSWGQSTAPVTLRVQAFESLLSDAMKIHIQNYKKIAPNVTIELETSAYPATHEKQMIELASGTGRYDILVAVTEWMTGYIAGGYLEPLGPYIQKEGSQEKFRSAWTPGLLAFEQDGSGELYGLPYHDGPQLLYYRKDLFNDSANKNAFKAKYKYDLKAPETWDQFLDIAKFFTRPDQGLWGTVQTAKFGAQQLAHDFWLLLPLFGGGRGYDEKWAPTFNSPAGVEAAQFYADLMNKYKVSPKSSTTFDVPEGGDFYLTGKAAMHWNWSHIGAYAELPQYSKIIGKNAYTIMPKKPGVGQQAVYSSYWVHTIAKTSNNKQAAWDFIKFITNKENDKVVSTVGGIPCRLSSWNDPSLLAKFPFYAEFSKAYSGMVTSSPRVPEYEQIDDLMQRYLSKIIAQEMDAKTALDSAANEYTDLLKKSGRL